MKIASVWLTLVSAALFCLCCSPAGSISDPTPAAPAFTLATPVTAPDWQLPAGDTKFGPTDAQSAFCGNRLPAPTRPFSLVVPQIRQEQSKWCALGAIEMIAEYYGLTVEQCRMASRRAEFPELTCCASPTHELCDLGTPVEQSAQLLSEMGLYGAFTQNVTEALLLQEVSNGRPMMFIEAAAEYAHQIVLAGYDPPGVGETAGRFVIYDPGNGFHSFTYQEMRSEYWNGASVMTGAFYGLSPQPDGCNPDFDPECGCQGGVQFDDGLGAAQPFGNYDDSRFAADVEPTGTVNFEGQLFESWPTDGAAYQGDHAAIKQLATYFGTADASWCQVATLLTGDGSIDCCAAKQAELISTAGITTVNSTGVDAVSGASETVTTTTVQTSCGQVPSTWRVGPNMADLGLSGLHVNRPLSHLELRREMANRRPVLVRTRYGTFGQGSFLLVAGWAPIESGGDRFMVVRMGGSWEWKPYLEIIEGRDNWLPDWTDTWFRLSASQ